MGERLGVAETFLDGLFAGELPASTASSRKRADYAELIAQGGFPEMVLGATTNRFRTALAAHLVGQTADDLAHAESRWFGPLLASFVVSELAKQATWSERRVSTAQYRDRDQREVDVVVERGRHVAGVEIKATSRDRATHDTLRISVTVSVTASRWACCCTPAANEWCSAIGWSQSPSRRCGRDAPRSGPQRPVMAVCVGGDDVDAGLTRIASMRRHQLCRPLPLQEVAGRRTSLADRSLRRSGSRPAVPERLGRSMP